MGVCVPVHTLVEARGGVLGVLFYHPLPYSLERRSPIEARLAASEPQQFLGILSSLLSLRGPFCLFLMWVLGFKLRFSCLCDKVLSPMESSSWPFDKSLLVAVCGIKGSWKAREITKKALMSEK